MNREIELAKKLLESKGYTVSNKVRESRDNVKKRITHTKEFDNGHVLHGGWKRISVEDSEEEAKQRSLENPDNIYYVQYDDIMNPSSDKYWKNGQLCDYKGNPISANESKKMREAHTVELYKSHTGEPKRKRFIDYDSAKEFADSQTDHYEEIVITIPTVNGPSIVNSWNKSDGWYRTVESKTMNESEGIESHEGWDYYEMPEDYKGPWTATQYTKDYMDLYLTIYPPQQVPGDEPSDNWHAQIEDAKGSVDIAEYKTGFKSFEDAESWINTWLDKHGYNLEESKLVNYDEDSVETEQGRNPRPHRGRKPNADLKDDGVFTPGSEDERDYKGESKDIDDRTENKYIVYYSENTERGEALRHIEISAISKEDARNKASREFDRISNRDIFHIEDIVLSESNRSLRRSILNAMLKLNESATNDDIFKVGDVVSFSMLYGGTVTAEVVDRSEDKLTLREKWTAEDTGEPASADTSYDIKKDSEGSEYIVTWEYHGHEGVAYPPRSKNAE